MHISARRYFPTFPLCTSHEHRTTSAQVFLFCFISKTANIFTRYLALFLCVFDGRTTPLLHRSLPPSLPPGTDLRRRYRRRSSAPRCLSGTSSFFIGAGDWCTGLEFRSTCSDSIACRWTCASAWTWTWTWTWRGAATWNGRHPWHRNLRRRRRHRRVSSATYDDSSAFRRDGLSIPERQTSVECTNLTVIMSDGVIKRQRAPQAECRLFTKPFVVYIVFTRSFVKRSWHQNGFSSLVFERAAMVIIPMYIFIGFRSKYSIRFKSGWTFLFSPCYAALTASVQRKADLLSNGKLRISYRVFRSHTYVTHSGLLLTVFNVHWLRSTGRSRRASVCCDPVSSSPSRFVKMHGARLPFI